MHPLLADFRQRHPTRTTHTPFAFIYAIERLEFLARVVPRGEADETMRAVLAISDAEIEQELATSGFDVGAERKAAGAFQRTSRRLQRARARGARAGGLFLAVLAFGMLVVVLALGWR